MAPKCNPMKFENSKYEKKIQENYKNGRLKQTKTRTKLSMSRIRFLPTSHQ